MGRNVRMFAAGLWLALVAGLWAPRADGRLDMDRYERLREAERYQMDMAEKLFGERKWKAARNEYDRFMKLYKDSRSVPYCQFKVAECDQKSNLKHSAIKEFTKVVDFWPDSPDAPTAQYMIALCYWETGDREKAVAAWQSLLRGFPKSPFCIGALRHQADYYGRMNKTEEQVEKLEGLVSGYGRERGWERDWDAAWDTLYWHYCRAIEPAKSLAVAERRLSSEDAMMDNGWRFRRVGQELAGAKQAARSRRAFDAARGCYETVMEKGTKSRHYPGALWGLGDSYREEGRIKEAIETYERYLVSWPEDDGKRNAYAWHLFHLRKYAEAQQQCLQFKDAYSGRRQMAEMYGHRKMVEDCIGTLHGLAEKYPDRAGETFWRMAEWLRHFRKHKEAIETYTMVATKYPERSSEAYWHMGWMHEHEMGKVQAAIKFYEMSSKEPESLFRIAECFRKLGKQPQAVETLRTVIGFFSEQAPRAQFTIAEYYRRWAKHEEAQKAYLRVCEKYPKSGESRRAHDILEMEYKMHYTGGGVKKGEEENQ